MPYEVVAALAEELRRQGPVLLVLEDVHWADEATLDVFRLLVRRIETLPALVVASYRDDGLDAGHRSGSCSASWPRAPRSAAMKLCRTVPVGGR